MLGKLGKVEVEKAPDRCQAQTNNMSKEKKPSSSGKSSLDTRSVMMGPVSMYLLGSAVPKSFLCVRALHDYDADDETKISFRRGDIIRVVKKRESGWWLGMADSSDNKDGQIHRGRDLFPSNCCTLDLDEISITTAGRKDWTTTTL